MGLRKEIDQPEDKAVKNLVRSSNRGTNNKRLFFTKLYIDKFRFILYKNYVHFIFIFRYLAKYIDEETRILL